MDESIVQTNDMVNLLYGPYLRLKKGTYSVVIDYNCEIDQNCTVYAGEGNDVFIKSGMIRLSSRSKRAAYRFTLTEDIDNLEIIVKYNGQGAMSIHNITVWTNSVKMRRILAVVLLVFLLLDIGWIFQKRIVKNKNLILAIVFIVMLSSLPLLMKGMVGGHDINFHLLRIDGLAEEIRNGNFPVRISSLWMDGYGYPISIFYGDILLYFPAFLRVIGFPVITVYKIYILCVNLATVIISYICFNKIFLDKKIALLLSMVYATAGYRVVNIYVRSAVGEFSAMIFLPIIALALYRIYSDIDVEWKRYKWNAWILAAGMSGLVCTHILSTEMTIFVLILVCIALSKKTMCSKVLKIYLSAALKTVVLSSYFLIPFLDYYVNEKVNITEQVDEIIQKIQGGGAYIGQYFAFFQDIAGNSSNSLVGRMGLTPGPVLMLTLLAAMILCVYKKNIKEIMFFTFFSMLTLFIASNLFPWDHLAQNCELGIVLSQVQFPWRYIGIASIFLTMLLGFLLLYFGEKEALFRKNMYAMIAGSCIFMSFFYVSNYVDDASYMADYQDTAELDTYPIYGGQYLKPDTDIELFSSELKGENIQEAEILARHGCRMELYCSTTDKTGSLEVPILNYKGYCVTDEYGKTYEILTGTNNVIKFEVAENFSGKIQVQFSEPWYWKLGEWISLLALVYFCISLYTHRACRI